MKETELINQIKSLQGVKPSQAWVEKTERNILGEEKSFSFSWTPLVASLAIMGVVLAGVAGYYYFPRETTSVAENPSVFDNQMASLAPSLENLKGQIDEASENLKVMAEGTSLSSEKKAVIRKTIEESQQIVEKIQALDEKQSLSSLMSEVETSRQGLMIEFTRREIEKLKEQKEEGLLPEEKMEGLAMIENLMAEGQAEEAFYQLLLLGNGSSPLNNDN
jgi:sensor c-di-GMP phosphodiesterase-like protein